MHLSSNFQWSDYFNSQSNRSLSLTVVMISPPMPKVGTVYQFRLMIDSRGHNKGFGFVTYADPATAQRAVKELDQSYLREHKYTF